MLSKTKLYVLLVLASLLLTGCGKTTDVVGVFVDGTRLVVEKGGKKSSPSFYTGREAVDRLLVDGMLIDVTYTYSDNFILSRNNPNQISPDLAQSSGRMKYIGYNFGNNLTIFREEGLDVGIFEAAVVLNPETKDVNMDNLVSAIYDFYKNHTLFKPKEEINGLNLNGIVTLDISGQNFMFQNGVFSIPSAGVSIVRVNDMSPFENVTNDKVFNKDVLLATYRGAPVVVFNNELAVINLSKAELENLKRE